METDPHPLAPTTLAQRQLDALCQTYPAWDIECALTEGKEEWSAILRAPLTDRLRSAGVRKTVEGPDAITVASALAHQQALLHNSPATTWTVPESESSSHDGAA